MAASNGGTVYLNNEEIHALATIQSNYNLPIPKYIGITSDGKYYRNKYLTDEELKEYRGYIQLASEINTMKNITTIKKWIAFWSILSIAGFIACFISILSVFLI